MKHQLWKPVTASLLLVLASNVLSPVEACNKNNADRLGEFVLDEKNGGGGSEIHHHHHYNKDGQLLPGPPSFPPQALQVQTAPIVESANPGGYSGHSAGQQIIHLNTGNSEKGVAKHVIVLQPAPPPPPPPAEEDLLASFFPKRLHHLHPKHFLKTHIHKLRHNFRSLLGHGHGHGKHSAPPPPPPPPPPQIIYQPQPIKISQIPLAQVEAYKPAALIPGSKVKAYAYISPDGYQPAVVVKQQKPHEHHIHHHPETPPHSGPHPSPEGPPHSHPPHQGQQVVYTGGSPHSEPSPYPHHHQQPGPPPPHPHYHSQPAPHSAYSPHYGHSQSPPPPQPHYHTHSSPPYKPAYQPGYPSSGSGEYPGGNAYGPSGYNPSQSLYESSPHGHSGGESPYGHGSTSPYGSGGSHFPPGYGGSSIY